MEWGWLWKSAILMAGGIALMRLAGRKSISQMTIVTTVIMISLGSSIASPVGDKNVWKALGSVSVFVAMLIIIEYLSVKWNRFENLLSGKAVIVIEHGAIKPDNLKKIRMTVDQLEVRLRQKGIDSFEDVEVATIESNGQLGYSLYRHARPLTVGEFEKALEPLMVMIRERRTKTPGESDLFEEVQQKKEHAPKHLQ